jgi:SPP1 gp7 family putative phage head morphogenesis protein
MNKELRRIIDDVYAGKIKTGTIDKRLLKVVGSAVEGAMFSGFGKSFDTIDFTTPDAKMLTRLTRDVWQFSASKNYQQLRDTTMALVDEAGKARTFDQFKDEAKRINGQYNNTWLKTEYNQAVGSSTMAARWAEYTANADEMPYLQYDTAGDSNVRPEHQLLDGIIRKIIDEFWRRYYPPNGWGCRCSANQLSTSTANETSFIPKVPVPKMFQTNLAESGLVFPKAHPYYNGVPANVLRKSMQSLPPDVAYKNVYRNPETNGKVDLHILHGISEQAQNVAMAETLADYGYKIKLLPIIDTGANDLRKLLYKTDDFVKGKNPDALINNQLFELKWVNKPTYKRIQKSIYEKSKQCKNIYLKIVEALPLDDLYKPVNGIFKQSKTIKQVWIENGGEIIKYKNPNY